MASIISSCLQSIPHWKDFILPTPETYAVLVNGFQYFPIFTTIQWLLSYHPAGKTSLKSSPFNIPGRLAWFIMEITGPLNLLYILYRTLDGGDLAVLPKANQLVTALYLLHYVNRAVISPFVVAPSMSPIHAFIMGSAVLFNWVNSTCLAGWVLGYRVGVEAFDDHTSVVDGGGRGGGGAGVIPYLGLGLFVLGMTGNIYSEQSLFRLRREEADKRTAKKNDNAITTDNSGNVNKYSKVYVIPPKKGIFRSILYPHYVFEWIEWFGFVLVGTAVFPAGSAATTAAAAAAANTPSIKLAPWLLPAAVVADRLRVPLPLPALVFFVNAVANMLPHARWGRKWYVDKFGEDVVGRRGAAVPWCPWM